MALTPKPTPPTRARSDDHEAQPSPKKLKSAVQEKAPRRIALRDVTNELQIANADSAAAVQHGKKAPPSKLAQRKPSAALSNQYNHDETVVGDVTPADPTPEEPDLVDDHAASPSSRTCGELRAFDHLTGQEEEDELASIMYSQLRERQMRNRVLVDYFGTQHHINEKMRCILINWLIEVHHQFKLANETLFLAVNYLDRYLARTIETTRSELQLIGLTCLFIAAKFEEVEPMDLADAIYVSDKTYDGDQIIAMERKILEAVGFNLAAVTAQNFLGYFSRQLQATSTESQLASFIAQSTLFHLPLLACYPPAERAAAAQFLARCVSFGERPHQQWITQWETTTACSLADMHPCLEDHCTIMAHQSKRLSALKNKFLTKRFGRVATKLMDRLRDFL